MSEKIERDVQEALESGDLNRAVDRLKTGLKREPYWAWGHRTLGDIYFEELNHTNYALVEYRKLREVKESLTPAETLRLAWAYQERDFEDKIPDLIADIKRDDLPETIELIGTSYDARKLYDQFRDHASEHLREESEEYFEKYRRQGDQYREHGNFFEAQQAYEKALEFRSDDTVRLELARCLIQRSRYPQALDHLKSLRESGSSGEDVDRLIDQVYSRLGLDKLFESDNDDEDPPGRSRKVS
jgi:tetratricopeptide (TPR) repeat protein